MIEVEREKSSVDVGVGMEAVTDQTAVDGSLMEE